LGIIFAKSGGGEAIMANRFKGVRAIVYYGKELEIVRLGREHNNANVLSLGAYFMNEEEAIFAIDLWLSSTFSNDDKHLRRVKKLDE
ncbi:MAG: RpiB/LacA/LacB family sugar-phosphate isomerase, partial [Patescibacteria group bacterium]